MSDSPREPGTVSFRRMEDATPEDFEIIAANDRLTDRELPDRILEHLRMQADDCGAYQIDRLAHVLQTATRAEADGADEDWIVGCLLHDLGDVLAPHTHAEVAAEILRPFVRDEVTWVVGHHGLFQKIYYANLSEEQRHVRRKLEGHPYYELAVRFCQQWDQCSFDPDYPWQPLEHFEPIVRQVFTRRPFSQS